MHAGSAYYSDGSTERQEESRGYAQRNAAECEDK